MRAVIKRGILKQERETMNKGEACRFLGVSYRGLYQLMKNGGLPYKQVGRMYLFYRPLLENWLASNDAGGDNN